MSEENQIPSQSNLPMDPDVEANKTVAALSYLSILCLVPLVLKKDSKFCQFHAKQGLVMVILSVFTWIPVIGLLLGLALLALAVLAIVRVLNGEWWEIPYIYDWSKKFNL